MASVASFFADLLLSFIPIFVAMDAIGVLPFVLSLTQDMGTQERTRTVRYAILTALGLGLAFIIVGKSIFWLLGISVADFLVAGGIILLVLSINHLIRGKLVEIEPTIGQQTIGVVPLGTPLIVGPAVLTTLLLLIDQYSVQGTLGIIVVIIAFIVNLAIAWLIFAQSSRVARLLRAGGMTALSKIASLLLAAIAVKMISLGIQGIMGVAAA